MTSTFVVPFPDKEDRTLSVNFACQRCCQPLKLHPSFFEIDDQTYSELTVPGSTDRSDRSGLVKLFGRDYAADERSVLRKIVLPVHLAGAESDFMVVDDLSNMPFDSHSHPHQSFRLHAALFDVLSDQSGIDHPMCEECTDSLLDQMDQQLTAAERESREYQDFLVGLEHKNGGEEEDGIEGLQLQLAALQEEEAELKQRLSEVEETQNETRASLRKCEEEHEALRREEDKQWQEYCRVQRQIFLSEEHVTSMDKQIACIQGQLHKLRNTNVFNATFHIWHSGHFGTINGFRLGRLPNVPVEWPEINAAWGQTVLLLHSLAKKIDFTFERYRLVPYGNHSYIESLESKSKNLPLYCMGGRKYFSDLKFDLAMVAFLDCLQQFKLKIESGHAAFRLPYVMDKGKIIDKSSGKCYSIKIQFNTEEQWTKSLKFMLTNLKWALAWVSTQFHDTVSLDGDRCDKKEEKIEFPEILSAQMQNDFLAGLKNVT